MSSYHKTNTCYGLIAHTSFINTFITLLFNYYIKLPLSHNSPNTFLQESTKDEYWSSRHRGTYLGCTGSPFQVLQQLFVAFLSVGFGTWLTLQVTSVPCPYTLSSPIERTPNMEGKKMVPFWQMK